LLLFFPALLFAQDADDYEIYITSSNRYASLFRGELLPSYERKKPLDGSTYFAYSENFEAGSLLFRGKRYDGVILNLDAHLDELYIAYPAFSVFLTVNKSFVDEFSINKHSFVHHRPEAPSLLIPGYYQVLHTGKVKLYKKVQKMADFEASTLIVRGYRLKEVFYLCKDDVWYRVNSKQRVLNLFPEHKQAINRYLKGNQITFRASFEIALMSTIDFWESL